MSFIRKAFVKYPLLTNCGIYGSLYLTAEFSQQTILKKFLRKPGQEEKPYDVEVLKRYGVVGTFVMAPTLYYWYRFLDSKVVGTTVKIVVKKCLIDQFLFTPNLLVLFYVTMSVLERKRDVFEELRRKFVPTFVVSSCFWLPVQGINFSLVPPRYRVTYIGFASLLWANILCYVKRSDN